MTRFLMDEREIKIAKTVKPISMTDGIALIRAQSRFLIDRLDATCKNMKHRDTLRERKECRDCWNELLEQIGL